MTARDPQLEAAISDLANALQTAAPLATQLRRELNAQAQDAQTLEAAIDRATLAVRQLRPGGGVKGGDR